MCFKLEIALALIDMKRKKAEPSAIIGFEALDCSVFFNAQILRKFPFNCTIISA